MMSEQQLVHRDHLSNQDFEPDENIPPKSFSSSLISPDQYVQTNLQSDDYLMKEAKSESLPTKSLQESLAPIGIAERSLNTELLMPEYNQVRKASLMECEISCEEVQDDEEDIRRKINQKLIKNKNFLMDFVAKKDKRGAGGSNQALPEISSNQKAYQVIDKRSRSETPDKMSATEVLFRAHQKLQMRMKESPQKLLEKHQQRQKKAEELRAQIENSKKNWYEKMRIRQQVAKEKWKELLAERKAKLYEKLEQADERRETEIQSKKNKAEQEIQKIDETNYIFKMTMNNMKLDLNMKMNETQERRNQILEEHKRKQHDRHLKEEAAEKRRQEMHKETENKFHKYKKKQEQAEQRRIRMLEEKKRAAQEAHKRNMVQQRKNDLGDMMSDVMSFVSNSENIWDFLGTERDWQELGLQTPQDEMIYELLTKDHFELEKMKLKMDSELLNQMILIDEVTGTVTARKEYLPLVKKKKPLEYETSSSEDDVNNENEIFHSPEKKNLTPSKLKVNLQNSEEVKQKHEQIEAQDLCSDGSDKDSIADETSSIQEEERKLLIQTDTNERDYSLEQPLLTDEAQNHILWSNRIKMSMKRNILRKNLSEDLTWADFLKIESYQVHEKAFQNFQNTRSMQSTPERKSEIPSESMITDDVQSVQRNSNSSSILSPSHGKQLKSKKKKSNKHLHAASQGQVQNTSSSSNLSDKSRISSVVYPSKKKKNPKNQNINQVSEARNSGSFISKQKTSLAGSNQSSTQSLLISNSIISGGQDGIKDQQFNPRKSVVLEQDSARKRQNARMHSSSVQEPSSSVQNLGQLITNTTETEEKFFETQSNASMSHTGSQMNQLITNSKPILPLTKVLPKKLSANAIKILFPITQQKLLFKRPGKEGQFGKCKVTVKIEDLQQPKTPLMPHSQSAFSQQVAFATEQTQQDNKQLQQSLESHPVDMTKLENVDTIQEQEKKGSNHNTPQFSKRRESTDTNNSSTNQAMSVISSQNAMIGQDQHKDAQLGTPTQQSKLWLLHQKFWEKTQSTSAQSNEQQKPPNFQKKIGIVQQPQGEATPSPKKDGKPGKQHPDENALNSSSLNISQVETPALIPIGQMNEQGYKELIIKYLLTDNISYLKTDDTQKTIFLEGGEEANKVIDYLEQNELQLRYCRLCDLLIPDHSSNEAHIQTKSHKKTRDELGIKEHEDHSFSILSLQSTPGDIEKELLREKEKALKRKVKRLKAQMIAHAVSHETASYCPGKEVTSQNKKRFQILCIELEKQVIPSIKDYDILENDLKEIIKILDMRKQADLHLMRKLKFIPILIEICKRISVCHKNEFKHLGRALEYVIKIINIFCGLRENRNYMLQTNRMQALTELLNWCLNRPTQLFYGINFMPQLFHILTLHVKHRTPYECQQMKEMFIEYLISSQITMKIKAKFQIINGPLDLSEMMGQVPLFLLKSANFLESLTNVISMDARSRPVYEKSEKIAEHILFVVQNTELFGIIPMITTILLTRNQPFKPSQHNLGGQTCQKLLPQTILSLAITSIKIINNVYRMDYRFAQQIMSDFEIQEQLYHLFNYILFYAVETADKQEDSKELLHETILLMGYFSLNNEKNQALLCKGENTLLQKLCNLPFPYFCDKKLKEILFPTLIQASYKNERSLAIMDQEISIEMLVDFIQFNLKEELPRIIEEEIEYQSMSSVGHSAVERKSHRSPSISSTNSSQCSLQIDMINGNSPYLPMYMRFPKKLWKEAITFYSKVLQ